MLICFVFPFLDSNKTDKIIYQSPINLFHPKKPNYATYK